MSPFGVPSRIVTGLPNPGRCLVMGVINVTPDSFSDGGSWLEPIAAIEHGLQLCSQGADLVDVGGESTRPGAERPPVEEELRRVLPVIRGLSSAGVIVSIDTMRATVAEAAIDAGARVVNDVSGGQADPDMLRVVAEAGVPYVLMHWRGHSARMQDLATYNDVVAEVIGELRPLVDAALKAGVEPARIAVDPGIGFSKTAEHNWTVLSRLPEFDVLGHPVLVGTSRKVFLGRLLADPVSGEPRPPLQRDHATTATTALAAAAGAWCVRVHEVPSNVDAVRVAVRWGQG
jgi:dihydropteroate synthase